MSVVEMPRAFDAPPSTGPSTAVQWCGIAIDVLRSPDALEASWRKLESEGVASGFQAFDYISDWLATGAVGCRETPVIVSGRRNGDVVFILPLAVRRVGGIPVLMWLGQSHSNYGMGLFQRRFLEEQTGFDVTGLICEIARRTGAMLVHLDMQPAQWMGLENPFAMAKGSNLTGHDSYIVTFGDDFEADYRSFFSKSSLSKMRRKWRRIEDLGSASFEHPDGDDDRSAALDWFTDVKGQQLAEIGRANPFAPDHMRTFYQALALRRDAFLVDQLVVNGQREAVGLTLMNGRIAYYLNTAYMNSEAARYSPGSHLVHQLARRLHHRGMRVFDLGPGDVAYKHEWDPGRIPLRTAIYLVNPLALGHYAVLRAVAAGARAVRCSPRLRGFVQSVLSMGKRRDVTLAQ